MPCSVVPAVSIRAVWIGLLIPWSMLGLAVKFIRLLSPPHKSSQLGAIWHRSPLEHMTASHRRKTAPVGKERERERERHGRRPSPVSLLGFLSFSCFALLSVCKRGRPSKPSNGNVNICNRIHAEMWGQVRATLFWSRAKQRNRRGQP